MSNLMSWEEIEAAQLEINETIKEIESKFIQEDITNEDYQSLSYQLEKIHKTVLYFEKQKDEFLKDKI